MAHPDRVQSVEPWQLLELLSGLASSLAYDPNPVESLQSICELIASFLDVSAAGVSHLDNGKLQLVGCTDERIAGLQLVEDEYRCGPGMEAVASAEASTIDDLGSDSAAQRRWLNYARHAHSVGWRSMAHVPVFGTEAVLGVVSLYHEQPHRWVESELALAAKLVELVEIHLVKSTEIHGLKNVTENLQVALDSRVVIEQAKGILAHAYDIDVNEAFARLRAHARNHNVQVRVVADAVVNLGLRL